MEDYWRLSVIAVLILLAVTVYIASLYSVEAKEKAEEARANKLETLLEEDKASYLVMYECSKVKMSSDVRVVNGFVKSHNQTKTIGGGNVSIELKCLYDYKKDLVWNNVTFTVHPEFQDIDEYNKAWMKNQTQQSKLN